MGAEQSKTEKSHKEKGEGISEIDYQTKKELNRKEFMDAIENNRLRIERLRGNLDKNLKLVEEDKKENEDISRNQIPSGSSDQRGAGSIYPIIPENVEDHSATASNFNATDKKNSPNPVNHTGPPSLTAMSFPPPPAKQELFFHNQPPPANNFTMCTNQLPPNPSNFNQNQFNIPFSQGNGQNGPPFYYQNEQQGAWSNLNSNNFPNPPFNPAFNQNGSNRQIHPPFNANRNQFLPNNPHNVQMHGSNANGVNNPPNLNRNQNFGNQLNRNFSANNNERISNNPENRNQNYTNFGQHNRRFQGKQNDCSNIQDRKTQNQNRPNLNQQNKPFQGKKNDYSSNNQRNTYRNQNRANNTCDYQDRPLFHQKIPKKNEISSKQSSDQRNKEVKESENKNQTNLENSNDHAGQKQSNKDGSDSNNEQDKPTLHNQSPEQSSNKNSYNNQRYPSNRQRMNKQFNQQFCRQNEWRRTEGRVTNFNDRNDGNGDNDNQPGAWHKGEKQYDRSRRGRGHSRGRHCYSRERKSKEEFAQGVDKSEKDVQMGKKTGSSDHVFQDFNGNAGGNEPEKSRNRRRNRVGRNHCSTDRKSNNEADDKKDSNNSDTELHKEDESDSPSTSGESSSQGEKTRKKIVPHGVNKNKNIFKNNRSKHIQETEKIKNTQIESERNKPLSKNNLGENNVLMKYIGNEIPKFADAVFDGVSLYERVEGVLLMSDPTVDDPIIKTAETLLHIIEFKSEFPNAKSYFVDKF